MSPKIFYKIRVLWRRRPPNVNITRILHPCSHSACTRPSDTVHRRCLHVAFGQGTGVKGKRHPHMPHPHGPSCCLWLPYLRCGCHHSCDWNGQVGPRRGTTTGRWGRYCLGECVDQWMQSTAGDRLREIQWRPKLLNFEFEIWKLKTSVPAWLMSEPCRHWSFQFLNFNSKFKSFGGLRRHKTRILKIIIIIILIIIFNFNFISFSIICFHFSFLSFFIFFHFFTFLIFSFFSTQPRPKVQPRPREGRANPPPKGPTPNRRANPTPRRKGRPQPKGPTPTPKRANLFPREEIAST